MGTGLTGCGWFGDVQTWLSAGVVAWLVTKALIPVLRSRNVMDIPGDRSSHEVPTPRGGGVGIIAGFVVAVVVAALVCGLRVDPVFVVALAIVSLVGWADDLLGGLPVGVRLLSQLFAAFLVVGFQGGLREFPLPAPANLELGWMGWVLSVLWIVGVTNVYNFLDGIDGYAAVQGVVAGLGLAVVGGGNVAAIGLAVAGACLGFLPHNWHPAKVFMGDVGSSFLGFLFAALPFLAPSDTRPRLVFAVGVLLWFFLADGAFTFMRRALRRERVWTAHRSHLYQRLVRTGLRHDQVTTTLGLAMVGLTTTTVVVLRTRYGSDPWTLLVLAHLLLLGLVAWVLWRETSHVGEAPN